MVSQNLPHKILAYRSTSISLALVVYQPGRYRMIDILLTTYYFKVARRIVSLVSVLVIHFLAIT